jgi:hypothetical protein
MDVQPQPVDVKAYAERLEVLCRAQADEITRLRSELARATEGANSLAVLQSLYRDDRLPEALRAKCAIGCLPHEVPRLESVPPPLDLVAEEIEPLSSVVERQRARADRMLALSLEERAALIPGLPNANGGGDDSDH